MYCERECIHIYAPLCFDAKQRSQAFLFILFNADTAGEAYYFLKTV